MRPKLLTAGLAVTLVACNSETGSTNPNQDVVFETIGDTTVVRTLSGSVWGGGATLVREVTIGKLDGEDEYLFGNVYSIAVDDDRRVLVLDGRAAHVRIFDSTGVYVETLGGPGEGPGALHGPAAVAVLPDGRVVVQDVGKQRIEVFGPGARETDQWAYSADAILLPYKPLHVGTRGRTFVPAAYSTQGGDILDKVVVFGPDGTQQKTLLPPGNDFEPPSVEVRLPMPIQDVSSVPYPVPLTARSYWAIHPSGHFLAGISTEYRIDLWRDDGVLRIERAFEPVAVAEAERSHYEEQTTRNLRVTQRDWRWNGPPVPATKPPFNELIAGRDGRIWVRLWTDAHPVENENHNPANPASAPVRWESFLRYDAFEPDGTYLGVLVPPDDFVGSPRPVFDGDHVWAVTRDELDVARVVRYRIVVGGR